jgi:lipopolysaccharide export system permease protein
VNWLPSLLIIALFIAVLSTLSRAHRDSEMVVWFASGQSLTAWIKPVLSFAIPMIVIIILLAFFVAPWANKKTSESKRRFDQREDISQVVAGQFRETNAKDRVFFVESLEKDLTAVKNIFVMQRRNEQQTIVVATNGFIKDDGKDRFLVLENGRRYDPGVKVPELKLLSFETHGIRLDPKQIDLSDSSGKVKPFFQLFDTPNNINFGELHWRFGLPVMAIILCLLAIPLSYVNPRVGRSANVIGAILIFFIYNALLTFTQAQITSGKLKFAVAVFLLHGSFLLLTVVLFAKRTWLGGFTGAIKGSISSRRRPSAIKVGSS